MLLVREYSVDISWISSSKVAKSSTIRVAISITIPSRFLRFVSSCLRLSSIPFDLFSEAISYQAPQWAETESEKILSFDEVKDKG